MISSAQSHDQDTVIGLIEVEPDLARKLRADELEIARRFALPVGIVEKDDDARALLERSGAFGGLVLEGLLLEGVNIGEHVTLRLLGPGAPIPPSSPSIPLPWISSRVFASAPTRVVLLDERYLLAARRWPSLTWALHARMSEHSQRHTAQLAISHLPRVEDRLMALMWLLADTWGRVTPAGIRIEVSLSHEVLGGLIGSRRPTVTLALGHLAEGNALIRQDQHWLILEQPPTAGAGLDMPQPALAPDPPSPWQAMESETMTKSPPQRFADLVELREQSRRRTEDARRLCEQSAALHAQAAALASELLPRAASPPERTDTSTVRPLESDRLPGSRQPRRARRGERIRRSRTSKPART